MLHPLNPLQCFAFWTVDACRVFNTAVYYGQVFAGVTGLVTSYHRLCMFGKCVNASLQKKLRPVDHEYAVVWEVEYRIRVTLFSDHVTKFHTGTYYGRTGVAQKTFVKNPYLYLHWVISSRRIRTNEPSTALPHYPDSTTTAAPHQPDTGDRTGQTYCSAAGGHQLQIKRKFTVFYRH